jgi:glycosyltransferase involved in cell wall biosynthesis
VTPAQGSPRLPSEPPGAEHHRHRPKAIHLAYCCGPGEGSESGTGWNWAKLASEGADITLIASPNYRENIDKAIAELELPITVHYVTGTSWADSVLSGKVQEGVAHLVWQTRAARLVRQIERQERIDVAHHVSFSSSSLPTALLASRAPVRVWGPVGGATRTPFRLYRYLTVRGMLGEVLRDVVNGTLRATSGTLVARHATLIIALNQDDERRFRRGPTPIVVETTPGVLESALAFGPREPTNTEPTGTDTPSPHEGPAPFRVALFVARLLPWKGLLLSIRSLQYAPSWKLVVLGEGPDRPAAEKLAASLGVSDRIEFRGRVPRTEVLGAFRSADALLFPSFHDTAGWVAGEASAMGCPVVCLDAGGPALQAGHNACVVPMMPAATLPRRLGERLEGLGPRGEPDYRLLADRIPPLLREWYAGKTGAPASATKP